MKSPDMYRVRWIASRLLAAIAGALIVGLIAALALTVDQVLTCGPTCSKLVTVNGGPTMRCVEYGSTCSGLLGPLLFYAIWTPIFSVPLGVLPGLVALTLTPASRHPWRALPALILATLVGFGIWMCLALTHNYDASGFGLLTLFVIPSVTGLAVAWNIGRLPKPFRLAP